MSVLSCSRRGCRSIMCDRYSYEFGRICNRCFDLAVQQRIVSKDQLAVFMETEDIDEPPIDSTVLDFLNGEFMDDGVNVY